MLVIIVLFLLLAALSYPYASVLFARFRMLRHLLDTAKANGYRADGSFWGMLTARNRSDRYELLLVREDSLIAVKLWAAYRRSDSLLVTERGHVVLCRSGRTPMDTGSGTGKSGMRRFARPKSVPRTRLPKKYAERSEIVRILLVYPSYREIVKQSKNDRRAIVSGDMIFDKQLHSPSSLESFLSCGNDEQIVCKNEEQILDKNSQNTKV